MNGQKVKQIRKKARLLQVEWINSLLPDGEQVTLDTLKEAMPDQTHFMQNRTLRLSFMSNKWIEKQVKRNFNVTLKELTNRYGQ
jgi:hypothetical protein|tara:strand:- start:327 stop:578 length:252 start_codon:yes stop_codon:yes gene_type:complete